MFMFYVFSLSSCIVASHFGHPRPTSSDTRSARSTSDAEDGGFLDLTFNCRYIAKPAMYDELRWCQCQTMHGTRRAWTDWKTCGRCHTSHVTRQTSGSNWYTLQVRAWEATRNDRDDKHANVYNAVIFKSYILKIMVHHDQIVLPC